MSTAKDIYTQLPDLTDQNDQKPSQNQANPPTHAQAQYDQLPEIDTDEGFIDSITDPYLGAASAAGVQEVAAGLGKHFGIDVPKFPLQDQQRDIAIAKHPILGRLAEGMPFLIAPFITPEVEGAGILGFLAQTLVNAVPQAAIGELQAEGKGEDGTQASLDAAKTSIAFDAIAAALKITPTMAAALWNKFNGAVKDLETITKNINLFDELKVPTTRGTITGDVGQQKEEENLLATSDEARARKAEESKALKATVLPPKPVTNEEVGKLVKGAEKKRLEDLTTKINDKGRQIKDLSEGHPDIELDSQKIVNAVNKQLADENSEYKTLDHAANSTAAKDPEMRDYLKQYGLVARTEPKPISVLNTPLTSEQFADMVVKDKAATADKVDANFLKKQTQLKKQEERIRQQLRLHESSQWQVDTAQPDQYISVLPKASGNGTQNLTLPIVDTEISKTKLKELRLKIQRQTELADNLERRIVRAHKKQKNALIQQLHKYRNQARAFLQQLNELTISQHFQNLKEPEIPKHLSDSITKVNQLFVPIRKGISQLHQDDLKQQLEDNLLTQMALDFNRAKLKQAIQFANVSQPLPAPVRKPLPQKSRLNVANYHSFVKGLNRIFGDSKDNSGVGHVYHLVKTAAKNEMDRILKNEANFKDADPKLRHTLDQYRRLGRIKGVEFAPHSLAASVHRLKTDKVTPKQEVDAIYKTVISGSVSPIQVRRMTNILRRSGEDGIKALNGLQGLVLQDIVEKGFDPDGNIKPQIFLNRFDTIGNEKIKAIFQNNKKGLEHLEKVKQAVRLLVRTPYKLHKGSAAQVREGIRKRTEWIITSLGFAIGSVEGGAFFGVGTAATLNVINRIMKHIHNEKALERMLNTDKSAFKEAVKINENFPKFSRAWKLNDVLNKLRKAK